MKVTSHAYAKVNLTLTVGARRDDGYHEVSTVMQTVDLCDTLCLTAGEGGLSMTCTDPAIPADESNLVLRAARLFFAETGRPVPDLRFELEKHIPSQAGLGGGSSDAAAVLLALRLFRAPGMPDEMLERMGAKLGSDVPFFIRGGTRRCTGRGERPQRLSPLRGGWFVIVKPPEGFATPEMYRRLDGLPQEPPRPDRMTEALTAGDIRAVAAALYNSFERVVPLDSAVWAIRDALLTHGALGAQLSGSGSAVFGLFDREDAARAAADVLRQQWPLTFVTRPV